MTLIYKFSITEQFHVYCVQVIVYLDGSVANW